MKSVFIVIAFFVFIANLTIAADPQTQSAPGAPATDKEKVSYGIGLNIGKNIKQQGLDLDSALLIRGIQDALGEKNPLMSDQQVREALEGFQKQMMAKQQEEHQKQSEKNSKEGEAFLAANKSKQGVVTLPSGLQYKVVQAGKGPKPKSTDTVTTHYRGKLLDGTEFDSSYSRNEPATFPVSGVIAGWTEALQLMPVGSKWELFIPAKLAYGEKGAGDVIGPNATLIFDVELISIGEAKAKEGASQSQPTQ